jgi:hypothetical protein
VKRIAIALTLVLAACSSGSGESDTSDAPILESTSPSSTATTSPSPSPSDSDGAATTTTTVVTGDARFIIGDIVFGDAGSIEVGNLGPDAGDLTGHWLAVHPFYLEMPAITLAPGRSVIVSLDENADPDLVIPAAGLIGPLNSSSGEIGLYASGAFGDPSAMVDYVLWGSTNQVRYPVAVAAGLWPEDATIVVDGSAAGLTIVDRTDPGPQGWAAKAE